MTRNKEFHSVVSGGVVNVRCPACHRNGAFHVPHGNFHDALFNRIVARNSQGHPTQVQQEFYGIRVCPNLDCGEPLFTIQSGGKTQTFPVEMIDFDPKGVPEAILASFTEAIMCHANACFKASAIMVRRTLEEICAERAADGDNLKQRIAALSAKVIMPRELLEAADELRILGNDAAHLEAKVYDQVGEEEVLVGLDLCKEILKAVYQLSSLVERLKSLKK